MGKMKYLTGVVAVWLIAVCAAFAKPAVEDGTIRSVYDLEALLFESQEQFLPIAPPSTEVYLHSESTVHPVDWKKFPKDFTRLMYAQMDANGFPIYPVKLYEDPVTREVVFLNLKDSEVYRLEAQAGYDPYYWQKTYFQLDTGEELDDWTKWIFDPAHISTEIRLIPAGLYEDYLSVQTEEAALESMMTAPMMMSLQLPVTNLQLAIDHTTNGTVEVEIGWPSSFTNKLEIFATDNLVDGIWQVVCTDISTTSSTNYFWEDQASTNISIRSYCAGNMDIDTDEDGLSNAREDLVYGSKVDDTDSDDDGLSDDVEVTASLPTDPSDADRVTPTVTIASPISNMVVMP